MFKTSQTSFWVILTRMIFRSNIPLNNFNEQLNSPIKLRWTVFHVIDFPLECDCMWTIYLLTIPVTVGPQNWRMIGISRLVIQVHTLTIIDFVFVMRENNQADHPTMQLSVLNILRSDWLELGSTVNL